MIKSEEGLAKLTLAVQKKPSKATTGAKGASGVAQKASIAKQAVSKGNDSQRHNSSLAQVQNLISIFSLLGH